MSVQYLQLQLQSAVAAVMPVTVVAAALVELLLLVLIVQRLAASAGRQTPHMRVVMAALHLVVM
jgi:hypothetical protein